MPSLGQGLSDLSNFLPPSHIVYRLLYVDKLNTGFLTWGNSIKAYRSAPPDSSAFTWEASSQTTLQALSDALSSPTYFTQLASLLGQESTKNPATLELRAEHVIFMKSLGMLSDVSFLSNKKVQPFAPGKMFEDKHVESILSAIEPLLTDSDRFKQRAGTELLAGLLRGEQVWRN